MFCVLKGGRVDGSGGCGEPQREQRSTKLLLTFYLFSFFFLIAQLNGAAKDPQRGPVKAGHNGLTKTGSLPIGHLNSSKIFQIAS